MRQISILGCGWLGMPLAEYLISNDFIIKGSTTSECKILDLKNVGITPFLVELNEIKINENIEDFLENSAVLIIAIPPKLRTNPNENFVEKIKKVIPFIENSSVENVLFISSISVYSDNNQTVTESTVPNPESESGKQIYATELLLKNNTNFKTTIIRFGGLIGENRHPIYSLSSRKNISNPDSPINLIHLIDCIKIIFDVLINKKWNEIFNAVADFHPSKKDYYTQKAVELSLPLPEFDESKPSFGKLVLSENRHHRFVKI